MPIRPSMPLSPRPRWYPLAAAALLAAGVVACSDPFEVRATLDVVEDTLVLNSISDATAPIGAATVIDIADQPNNFLAALRTPKARRLGQEFYAIGVGFDVAVEVRGDSVTFLPPTLVTNELTTVRRVGLRRDTVAWERAAVAPNSGYVFDTIAVSAKVGQLVYVVSQHPGCASEFNAEMFAKIGVLAIDPAARTATLRVRLDPNCGFRSFLDGVPTR